MKTFKTFHNYLSTLSNSKGAFSTSGVLPLIVLCIVMITSCGSKPEVVQSVSSSMAVSEVNTAKDAKSDNHEVVVQDFLYTTKYTYLDVTENGERFWVAIPKREVEKGKTYYYKGGLKKRNFKSQEYDRVFETVYLVSGVQEQPLYSGNKTVAEALASVDLKNKQVAHEHIAQTGDGVSLEALFTNPGEYRDKSIEVSGKVVKVNNHIMGKNWVHIQDGTGGEKPYDLTITTSEEVSIGAVVKAHGKIALNKDFGAGYKYAIIMEEAHFD